MSTEPDRDPAALDRPLTVPMLVRGALDCRVLIGLLAFRTRMLLIRLNVRYRNPWDRVSLWYFLGVAAASATPAVLMTIYHLPRRRWIEVTLTGFVLTERRRRLALTDDDVLGLSRSFTTDASNGVNHRVLLE